MRNIVVGTAGHIDHGKSALVEALSGQRIRIVWKKRSGGASRFDIGFPRLSLADPGF